MKKLGQISYLSSIYKYPRVSLKIRPGCDLFGIEKNYPGRESNFAANPGHDCLEPFGVNRRHNHLVLVVKSLLLIQSVLFDGQDQPNIRKIWSLFGDPKTLQTLVVSLLFISPPWMINLIADNLIVKKAALAHLEAVSPHECARQEPHSNSW
jgi:hypothetical protein